MIEPWHAAFTEKDVTVGDLHIIKNYAASKPWQHKQCTAENRILSQMREGVCDTVQKDHYLKAAPVEPALRVKVTTNLLKAHVIVCDFLSRV